MDSNLAQFNAEIDAFAKSIPDKAIEMQKKIVLEALRRLVQKTPVKYGLAKGNWQVTLDNPAEGKIDAFDKSGQDTINKGMAVISNMPAYHTVWISNNLDYIEFLEDGSSQQAPQGMLAKTVEELRTMFEEAA